MDKCQYCGSERLVEIGRYPDNYGAIYLDIDKKCLDCGKVSTFSEDRFIFGRDLLEEAKVK